MIKICCLGALLLLAALGASAREIAATDDTGRAIVLPAPARRIVSLSPAVTELAYAAGSAPVGAARFSDYPLEARALPIVGDSSRLDLERILALRPDLVVGWKSGNSPADLERLAKLKLPVFVVEPTRLSDIPRLLRILGALAGTAVTAETAARGFEQEQRRLAQRYAGAAPVRVFYQIWHEPLMTVSGGHLISDVVRLCGGVNVFESSPLLAPAVTFESVLARDPDVIIVTTTQPVDSARGLWSRFPRLKATQAQRVLMMDADLIERQSPRILAGAKALCRQLDAARHSYSPVRKPAYSTPRNETRSALPFAVRPIPNRSL